ncbi:hypothetical protein, partial [Xanthomonas phaseoli]|uniref:hypothetical protein n=1 Tax=Xanthomonas phaseoli TaxID=1985254 RepID=UPI001AD9E7C9
LGKGYEKIPLLASANLWGDYHPIGEGDRREWKLAPSKKCSLADSSLPAADFTGVQQESFAGGIIPREKSCGASGCSTSCNINFHGDIHAFSGGKQSKPICLPWR